LKHFDANDRNVHISQQEDGLMPPISVKSAAARTGRGGALQRRQSLTPEALEMVETIARCGSFAGAARELGKVPSALTYSVRQLEQSLDVLLFDRRGQAQLTAAGEELLREGRRLLQQIDAVANRVRRVATGWETQLSIALDSLIASAPLYDLMQSFYALSADGQDAVPLIQDGDEGENSPPTRLKWCHEVLSGTWEALLSGRADLAIGLNTGSSPQEDIQTAPLGRLRMVLAVAPHHPLARQMAPVRPEQLARYRIVAIADTAQRLEPQTHGILPGQDVLTVPSLAAKIEAQLRGLGCGHLPEPLVRRHVEAGRLVVPECTEPQGPDLLLHYAWRRGAAHGKALSWWLHQLEQPRTRQALLDHPTGSLP
jgi:DNA-binding transcriptional LysR family regulator